MPIRVLKSGALLRLRVILFVLQILSCRFLFSQSDTASISGRVTDPSGAVLVGARVEASELSTGISSPTVTNEDGIYVLSDLRPGTYQIVVTQNGFRKVVLSDVALSVQDSLSRNFTMQLGPVSESVVVTDSEQVELSAAVSTIVEQQFVHNMPLNGRSFQSLLALTPGNVVAVPSFTQAGLGLGQLSINGQRANANYFMVDGMSWNYSIFGLGQSAGGTIPAFTIQGLTNGVVPVDAMQEFRVVTSTFSPELGRTPGAQISIVTRSGTNQWHGTVFDYLRNDAFDARNYFDAPPLPKPPLRQNDFGGTLGGPIRRNQLFFFFSYEGLRLRQPATATGNFYTAAARANVARVYQPLLAALPIPNGPGNSDGITAPLTVAYSDPARFDSYGLRIDYKLNQRVTMFARYSHSPSIESSHYFSVLGNATANVDSLTVGVATTFGSDKLNDFRANWSHADSRTWSQMVPFYGAIPPPSSLLYPPGYNSSTFRLVFFPGGQDGEVANGGGGDRQRQIEVADVFSISRGTHQIKTGGDIRQLTPGTGSSLDSLILSSYVQERAGIAGSVNMFNQEAITARLYNYSFFGQDVWRLTPRLTLTYGLRWEINTPLGSITPGKPLYNINGIFNAQPFGLIPVSTLGHTRFNDFAPRIGASFQVTPGTILRGGFGLFYDIGFGGGIPGSMDGFPYEITNFGLGPVPFNFSDPAFSPPAFTIVPNSSTADIYAVDPNLRLPLIYEWNIAVERALSQDDSLSVTYLGSYGVNLLRQDAIENNLTGVRYTLATRNADWSNYNALQIQYRRQMSHGLQALAAYTWAKALDTNSIDVCACTQSGSLQSIDVGRDYAPSTFDVRHSLAAAVSYQFPSTKRGGFAGALLRGWGLYGVVRISSAPPFNVYTNDRSPVFGGYRTRPDVVPGVPFYIPDPSNPGGRRLNAAAFTAPPPGEQGDLPRNYFRAFPIDQTDLALSRRFGLTERVSLYFRAEYFNVFNHPMFAGPPGNFNNFLWLKSFGKITSTLNDFLTSPGTLSSLYQVGGPRSGQLTLRIEF